MKFIMILFWISCLMFITKVCSIFKANRQRKLGKVNRIIDRDNRTFDIRCEAYFDKSKNIDDAIDWSWRNLWDDSFEDDPKIKKLNEDECIKRFAIFTDKPWRMYTLEENPSIGFYIKSNKRKPSYYEHFKDTIHVDPRDFWNTDKKLCKAIDRIEEEFGKDGEKYTIVGVWYELVVECTNREYADAWIANKFGKRWEGKNTPNMYINCCGNEKKSSWGI